jgi:hypothetical protein
MEADLEVKGAMRRMFATGVGAGREAIGQYIDISTEFDARRPLVWILPDCLVGTDCVLFAQHPDENSKSGL